MLLSILQAVRHTRDGHYCFKARKTDQARRPFPHFVDELLLCVAHGGLSLSASVAVKRGQLRGLNQGPVRHLFAACDANDDVREVANGMECGVALEEYEDFQVDDILEFFRRERQG